MGLAFDLTQNPFNKKFITQQLMRLDLAKTTKQQQCFGVLQSRDHGPWSSIDDWGPLCESRWESLRGALGTSFGESLGGCLGASPRRLTAKQGMSGKL